MANKQNPFMIGQRVFFRPPPGTYETSDVKHSLIGSSGKIVSGDCYKLYVEFQNGVVALVNANYLYTH